MGIRVSSLQRHSASFLIALGVLLLIVGGIVALAGVGNAAPPPAGARRPSCSLGDKVAILTATRKAGPPTAEPGAPEAALQSFLDATYPDLDASRFHAVHRSSDRTQFALNVGGRTEMYVDVDTVTGTWSVAEMSACNATLVHGGAVR